MSIDERDMDLLVGDLTVQLATVKRALVGLLAAADRGDLVASAGAVAELDSARRVVREL